MASSKKAVRLSDSSACEKQKNGGKTHLATGLVTRHKVKGEWRVYSVGKIFPWYIEVRYPIKKGKFIEGHGWFFSNFSSINQARDSFKA
jgi:hypothetical protein